MDDKWWWRWSAGQTDVDRHYTWDSGTSLSITLHTTHHSMAAAKGIIHLLLFVQSVFLYYAVLRLRETSQCVLPRHSAPERAPSGRASQVSARPLYVVTPTYSRPTQLADLTRLANTLRLVAGLHWLVAEDSNVTSPAVTELLLASGLTFTHLAALRPPDLVGKVIGRGVFNRRAALDWIRENAEERGVIYFADDDNSYDVRIFEEIRTTRKVSVFPVGLILKYGVSSPIVKDGVVTGFFDAFQAGRHFAMDMAGFAVSVKLFKSRPEATFPAKVKAISEDLIFAKIYKNRSGFFPGGRLREISGRVQGGAGARGGGLQQGVGLAHQDREGRRSQVGTHR